MSSSKTQQRRNNKTAWKNAVHSTGVSRGEGTAAVARTSTKAVWPEAEPTVDRSQPTH